MARKPATRRKVSDRSIQSVADAELAIVERHASALDALIEKMAADAEKFETVAGVRAMKDLRNRVMTEEGAKQMADLMSKVTSLAKKASARKAADT